MSLEIIQTLNPEYTIKSLTDEAFRTYGKVIDNNIMYNTLFNTLKNVANNELDVKKLLSHLSYPEFLSVIKNNK